MVRTRGTAVTEPQPRVVMVTGASSGIGLATALQAAEHGEHVVLLARGPESLDAAADRCRAAGAASAQAIPTDVADDAAVDRAGAAGVAGVRRGGGRPAVGGVVAGFGGLDAVIHSAGLVAYGRFEDVPVDTFDRVVRTNL